MTTWTRPVALRVSSHPTLCLSASLLFLILPLLLFPFLVATTPIPSSLRGLSLLGPSSGDEPTSRSDQWQWDETTCSPAVNDHEAVFFRPSVSSPSAFTFVDRLFPFVAVNAQRTSSESSEVKSSGTGAESRSRPAGTGGDSSSDDAVDDPPDKLVWYAVAINAGVFALATVTISIASLCGRGVEELMATADAAVFLQSLRPIGKAHELLNNAAATAWMLPSGTPSREVQGTLPRVDTKPRDRTKSTKTKKADGKAAENEQSGTKAKGSAKEEEAKGGSAKQNKDTAAVSIPDDEGDREAKKPSSMTAPLRGDKKISTGNQSFTVFPRHHRLLCVWAALAAPLPVTAALMADRSISDRAIECSADTGRAVWSGAVGAVPALLICRLLWWLLTSAPMVMIASLRPRTADNDRGGEAHTLTKASGARSDGEGRSSSIPAASVDAASAPVKKPRAKTIAIDMPIRAMRSTIAWALAVALSVASLGLSAFLTYDFNDDCFAFEHLTAVGIAWGCFLVFDTIYAVVSVSLPKPPSMPHRYLHPSVLFSARAPEFIASEFVLVCDYRKFTAADELAEAERETKATLKRKKEEKQKEEEEAAAAAKSRALPVDEHGHIPEGLVFDPFASIAGHGTEIEHVENNGDRALWSTSTPPPLEDRLAVSSRLHAELDAAAPAVPRRERGDAENPFGPAGQGPELMTKKQRLAALAQARTMEEAAITLAAAAARMNHGGSSTPPPNPLPGRRSPSADFTDLGDTLGLDAPMLSRSHPGSRRGSRFGDDSPRGDDMLAVAAEMRRHAEGRNGLLDPLQRSQREEAARPGTKYSKKYQQKEEGRKQYLADQRFVSTKGRPLEQPGRYAEATGMAWAPPGVVARPHGTLPPPLTNYESATFEKYDDIL